jgi:phosphoribosyl-ATP pyrophosphohydrolase
MQLIRCTGKLQKEMGIKKSELREDEPVFSYLGSWHANLIYINGKKCVLFNFIVTNVSKAEIKELSRMFIENLHCILADEGLEDATIKKIRNEYEDVYYAKTNNKSVLGSMNDLAFHYKLHLQEAGGVHSYLVPSIIKKLNHMPMGAINYGYPIDALRAMYEGHH